MTSKDFKRVSHFRSTAEKNCYNCRYCRDSNGSFVPYGVLSMRKRYCINDLLDNDKCKFVVSNFMVCDNWKRNEKII